ncbi:N-6 DNA methylase [Pseudomonas sp. 4810-S13]|uniref:N-6 DNA methylase n=1 Tax=Pseudomonas sp. 4810-S13 TaxID=3120822 RepID=UPI0031B6A0C6
MSSQVIEAPMQLSRIPKTSDQLGRYYTVQEVAGLLIQTMSVEYPTTVIELGVGDGALIREATQKWTSAKFITVDIDERAKNYLPLNSSPEFIQHHVGDALEYGLDQKIGVDFGTIDSAVCNPPYIRPKWRQHFSGILEEAGLQSILPKFGCMPAEVLFIAQNLRFLKVGGKLGLILPDGIISGEKFFKLREALTTTHRIERVIELPRRIFRNTDAKAHIMVLSKNLSPSETIQIQKLESSGKLSKIIELPSEMASSRLDYSYLAMRRATAPTSEVKLKDITKVLKRGTLNSVDRKKLNLNILHTTDFKNDRLSVPRKFITKRSIIEKTNFVFAQSGDILIARVGRNLNQKIWRVKTGSIIITDCVLLLRVDPIYVDRVFDYLVSNTGRENLASIAHGVGASFITMDGLLNMKITFT